MKNLLLCVVLCTGMVSLGHAQFRKIPNDVQDAFYEKYPDAEEAAWKNKEKIYQVSFLLMGIKFTADFDDKGFWLQCAQEIKPEGIPQKVQRSLTKSLYKDWLIKEAFFVIGPDERTEFRILVSRSEVQQRYISFDPEGKMLEDKDRRKV
ncbi:Putative beta-lactamase-inhibitor-like, PepSY-like [Filimonas lacunae]|uniref:Putative beta-lactamase-inhibitor-like, PepSY-like n=2 Tax=Filimonas lacunae TaxID=477680 RepID=A0A1N7R6S5_9BACT|nr:Putative beta-lactamase-inhibitor-like, PepSY-like [Filimonas lacunae]